MMAPAKIVVGVRITHSTRTSVGFQPRKSATPPQTPAMTLLLRERCKGMAVLLVGKLRCKRRAARRCTTRRGRREFPCYLASVSPPTVAPAWRELLLVFGVVAALSLASAVILVA